MRCGAAAGFLRQERSYSARIQERFSDFIEFELKGMRDAGTYKEERYILSQQSGKISSKLPQDASGKSVLNLCANNYLGWCNHPEILEAGKRCIDERGAGLSSVRFICGTQDIHKNLERKITQFHRGADTILYASCFDANAGFFDALFNEKDMIISDELNHASIIDGIRLSKAERARYKHSDMHDLERLLKESQSKSKRFTIIVSDGVFSMDGELANLKDIAKLADEYDALVFIDECHATGILGEHGRGTAELLGVEDKIDFINSTLGKALGGASGGYTVSRHAVFIDWLRNRSRPYLFSNTLPPAVVGIADQALSMLLASPFEDSRAYRARHALHENTLFMRHTLSRAGFTLKGMESMHPIIPIMLFDANRAKEMAQRLWDRNLYAVAFSYPVVPKDQARIRLQISAAHEKRDLEDAADTLIDIGIQLGMIQ